MQRGGAVCTLISVRAFQPYTLAALNRVTGAWRGRFSLPERGLFTHAELAIKTGAQLAAFGGLKRLQRSGNYDRSVGKRV
ncbi:hypothetical protein HYPDE_32753 [Hyphomicrobium denitrificans 1NES1]|uniref:Uncharacterized protein n=1 Tax=Hyphomicrobium denitrificans 1NES1 TaxID=670307 RepID=N0B5D2_9HYPH|nr:hypothetical protein HYPDE_32753 [Hyphomicrobium denitrificans 1NES1]